VNKQIRRLAAGLLICYAVLFVQLNILQVGQSKELDADSRNTRQATRDFNKPRGQIVSADGVVLAENVPSTDSKYKYQRTYPTADLFANVTGYYSFTYGATQLEKAQNDVLSGRTAKQQANCLKHLFGANCDSTGTVQLTMRNDLQTVARQALGDREGSVVLLDPRTGAILAMYSWPSFDPNLVAVHDSKQAGDVLALLNLDTRKPLLANAYQERYMPGSTFKVVTTTTGLEDGMLTLDTQFPVESSYTPPQATRPIKNYGGVSCGGDLTEVFRRSCNTPFARTGVNLGPDRWVAGVERFGLKDEAAPIDLPNPAKSTVGPTDNLDQNLPILALNAFGQGNDAITPLQMAMVAGSVANGGKMMKPFVVDVTKDHDGSVLSRTSPSVWKTPMSPATAQTMNGLMVEVVKNGTAKCCMQLANGVQAAAKTGTAQLNAEGQTERSHAWIIAYAPAEAPRYAIAVILKGVNDQISAGTGGKLAGPIAKTVLDYALSHEGGT
jgi:peptidoglycan glycosyltransferase